MSSETESIVKYLFSDCNVLFWPAHQQKTFKSFKCLKLAGNFIPWFLLTVVFFFVFFVFFLGGGV